MQVNTSKKVTFRSFKREHRSQQDIVKLLFLLDLFVSKTISHCSLEISQRALEATLTQPLHRKYGQLYKNFIQTSRSIAICGIHGRHSGL